MDKPTKESDKDGKILDDDEFVRLMSKEFEEAGEPKNEIRAEKVWQNIKKELEKESIKKVESTKKNKTVMFTIILSIAAATFFMVHQFNNDGNINSIQPNDSIIFKGNKDKQNVTKVVLVQKIAIEGEKIAIEILPEKESYVSVFINNREDIQLLLSSKKISMEGEVIHLEKLTSSIPTEKIPTGSIICSIGSTNLENLKLLEANIRQIWASFNQENCIKY